MIFKERDSREKDIKELQDLLNYRLSPKQRFLIEREIDSIKKGEQGENDSAYYINFFYGDSKRWIVIHDLRIEFNGRVAQIDHILINKFFDIYILESKNYKFGIKITNTGEFEVYYKKQYIGIPSPIEQNKRHIKLLDELIQYHRLLPKRLNIHIKPKYFNYVLISPKSIIKRPNPKKFNTSNVIKADTMNSVIEQTVDEMNNLDVISTILKMSSFSTIENFAKKLVEFHTPTKIDWKRKFGLEGKDKKIYYKDKTGYFCAMCKSKISVKEAKFCWNNKAKFKGKAFCYNCQKKF